MSKAKPSAKAPAAAAPAPAAAAPLLQLLKRKAV